MSRSSRETQRRVRPGVREESAGPRRGLIYATATVCYLPLLLLVPNEGPPAACPSGRGAGGDATASVATTAARPTELRDPSCGSVSVGAPLRDARSRTSRGRSAKPQAASASVSGVRGGLGIGVSRRRRPGARGCRHGKGPAETKNTRCALLWLHLEPMLRCLVLEL